ncbi:MAG: signal peptide peptidase SppA [Deltaproteobacteria bacterium]|nr:signal peptide peptidase SppA [Deltaproteobacteria bacterium]
MASVLGLLLRGALAGLPWLLIAGLRALSLRGRPALRVPLGADRDTPEAPAVLLRALADEPAVRAVDLDLRDFAVGGATLEDLRGAVLALRAAGKLVSAHADTVGLRGLQLLSAVDHGSLTPSGEVLLTGFASSQTFFADALALVGVRAELMSAGTYKSFGERYTRNAPSGPHREAVAHVLTGLWDEALATIAADRRRPVAALGALLGKAPLDPAALHAAGGVDQLAYPDQAAAELEQLLGGPRPSPSLGWWWRLRRAEARLRGFIRGGPRLCVVELDGPISAGAPGPGERGPRIDPDELVPVLDALREDPSIAGVVLAINSPGGSALASDLIARAVRRLADTRPVIALLGDVAASGGYYIAAPCSEIIARPSTITGSIGVVGGKIVLRDALTRLGVHPESITVGPDAELHSPLTGWDRDQADRFRASLHRTYARFLAVVAGGRGLPVEAVAAVAEGRIWTGRQALTHGLVDRLGDLEVALGRLRLLAGLPPGAGRVLRHRFEPPRHGLLRLLLSQVRAPAASAPRLPSAVFAALGGQSGALGVVLEELWLRPMAPLCVAPLELDAAWAPRP